MAHGIFDNLEGTDYVVEKNALWVPSGNHVKVTRPTARTTR